MVANLVANGGNRWQRRANLEARVLGVTKLVRGVETVAGTPRTRVQSDSRRIEGGAVPDPKKSRKIMIENLKFRIFPNSIFVVSPRSKAFLWVVLSAFGCSITAVPIGVRK